MKSSYFYFSIAIILLCTFKNVASLDSLNEPGLKDVNMLKIYDKKWLNLLIKDAQSPDPETQASAIYLTRITLSDEKSPFDDFIKKGIIKILVKHCLKSPNISLQQQAVLILYRMSLTDHPKYIQPIVDDGVLPHVIELLDSENSTIHLLSLKIIHLIITAGPEFRDYALQLKLMENFSHLVDDSSTPIGTLQKFAEIMESICRVRDPPVPNKSVQGLSRMLKKFLRYSNQKLYSSVTKALLYLTENKNITEQIEVDELLVESLVKLLGHHNVEIQFGAIGTIYNLMNGKNDIATTEAFFENDILIFMEEFLIHKDKRIAFDAFRILTKIIKHSQSYASIVFDSDLMIMVIHELLKGNAKIQKAAMSTIFYAVIKGTPENIEYLIDMNVLCVICNYLKKIIDNNPKAVRDIIKTYMNIAGKAEGCKAKVYEKIETCQCFKTHGKLLNLGDYINPDDPEIQELLEQIRDEDLEAGRKALIGLLTIILGIGGIIFLFKSKFIRSCLTKLKKLIKNSLALLYLNIYTKLISGFKVIGNLKTGKYYGFISTTNYNIGFSATNIETKEMVFNLPYVSKNSEDFINNLKLNNCFKFILIEKSNFQRIGSGYSTKFYNDLKDKLKKCGIPCYFISRDAFMCSSLLLSANVPIHPGETVIIVINYFDQITVFKLKRSHAGYQMIQKNNIVLESNTIQNKNQNLQKQIIGSTNPKSIIALEWGGKLPIKEFLTSPKLIVIDPKILEKDGAKFIYETSKWFFNKSHAKYHILPSYDKFCHLYYGYGKSNDDKEEQQQCHNIFSINDAERLPVTKTFIIPRNIQDCFVVFKQNNRPNEQQRLDFKRDNCHRLKLTANIDEEGFESFTINEINMENIKALPTKFEKSCKNKIPVIGFFDDFSICFTSKNGRYQFLDSWNGLYGIDHFISFEEERPKFGEDAMKMLQIKHSCVVFDILKIMSMPPNDIKIDPTYGFLITKDETNPVLIKFDHNNDTSAATPSFLMAMIIKQQIKAIRKESGEKPDEIGLFINNDQFSKDERKRVINGLEISCKMLKQKFSLIDS